MIARTTHIDSNLLNIITNLARRHDVHDNESQGSWRGSNCPCPPAQGPPRPPRKDKYHQDRFCCLPVTFWTAVNKYLAPHVYFMGSLINTHRCCDQAGHDPHQGLINYVELKTILQCWFLCNWPATLRLWSLIIHNANHVLTTITPTKRCGQPFWQFKVQQVSAERNCLESTAKCLGCLGNCSTATRFVKSSTDNGCSTTVSLVSKIGHLCRSMHSNIINSFISCPVVLTQHLEVKHSSIRVQCAMRLPIHMWVSNKCLICSVTIKSLLLKCNLCGESPQRGRLARPVLSIVRCVLYEGHCEALLHDSQSQAY